MAITRPLGQHGTIGDAGPSPAVSQGCVFGIPVALCCLALILLAIASTIVLSLIPVYLKNRDLHMKCKSDPIDLTFNVNKGILPSGQLSTNNRAALKSGLNGWLTGQSGFSHCSLEISNGNVGKCPSTRRLLQQIRKQQQEPTLVRTVRQTNTDCVGQQLTTTSALNCGCTCFDACLRQRVDRLNSLLGTVTVPITFPDGDVSVTIFGINVSFNPTTTATTSTTTTTTTVTGGLAE